MKRKEIAKNTLDIIDTGFYVNTNDETIDISTAIKESEEKAMLYTPKDFETVYLQYAKHRAGTRNFETQYEVTGETTLQAMERLHLNERNLLCLNFASAKNPGGGFMGGAQAQEESLARSSGLYYSISQLSTMYAVNRQTKTCLYTDHMIYSPGVPFFKNDHGELLHRPYHAAVLTVPAVNAGIVKQQESQEHIDRIDEVMMSRTEKLLMVAALQGHETLVLGAWGCGVFRNPAAKVSDYFKTHLLDNPQFNGAFKKIVFAILHSTSAQTVISPFREKFENKTE